MILSAISMSLIFLVDGVWLTLILRNGIADILLALVLLLFAHIASCIVATHLLRQFFPIVEGEFPLSSREVGYWQAQAVVALLGCIYFTPFVPFFLKPLWYRLFGARIAAGAVASGNILDCSLIRMEAGSSLGADAMVLGHIVMDGRVRIGTVHIERNAIVGAKSLIMPGAKIGAGATVGAMSLVASGKVIPANETWIGIPARKLDKTGF